MRALAYVAPRDIGHQEVTSIVRRRTFDLSPLGVVGVLVLLRREGFTGKLTVNLSCGGVNSIVAEDTQNERNNPGV